jgi:hypothetical protein
MGIIPSSKSWGWICTVFLLFSHAIEMDSTVMETCLQLCSKVEQHHALLSATNLTNMNLWNDKFAIAKRYPSLNVAFITRATPDIAKYAAYSYWITSFYAQFHNYWMIPLFLDNISRDDYSYHRKLVPLLDILENKSYIFDYIVWVDAGTEIFFPSIHLGYRRETLF